MTGNMQVSGVLSRQAVFNQRFPNFTASELEAVRTTEQDSLLMRNEYDDMAPYGSTEFTYIETKDTPAMERPAGNAKDGTYRERLSDTFFLLDAVQANAVYKNRDIHGKTVDKPPRNMV